MKQMLQICCKNNNISKEFPIGSSLLDIYYGFNLNFPYQVVSAKVNNRSEGLNFRVYNNKDVEFLDVRDQSGMRTYVRSLCFVLFKAVTELFPEGKLFVEHPVSKGYFCNWSSHRTGRCDTHQATDAGDYRGEYFLSSHRMSYG